MVPRWGQNVSPRVRPPPCLPPRVQAGVCAFACSLTARPTHPLLLRVRARLPPLLSLPSWQWSRGRHRVTSCPVLGMVGARGWQRGGCRQGKILPLLKGCAQTEPGSCPCLSQKGGRSCACVPPPYWGRQGGFLLCLTTSRWHKNGHLGLGDAVNSPGDPTFAPTQTQHSHRQSFQPVYCTGARMGLGVCTCACVFPVFSSPSVSARGWRLVPQRFPFLARPGRRKIIFPFVSRFPRPFGLEAARPEPGPAPSRAGRSVLRCGFRPAAPCLALPRCRESLGARFPCRCFPGAVG